MTNLRRAVAVALVLAPVSGCGWGDDGIESFYGAHEPVPGQLVLELAVCTPDADAVKADVTETRDAVRIDDVTGEVWDDDCAGVLQVDLDAPLRNRALVVDGEQWVPYDGTCVRTVTLVPPDIPEWFTDCPDGS